MICLDLLNMRQTKTTFCQNKIYLIFFRFKTLICIYFTTKLSKKQIASINIFQSLVKVKQQLQERAKYYAETQSGCIQRFNYHFI